MKLSRVLKRVGIAVGVLVVLAYGGFCGWILTHQPAILFQPTELAADYKFPFELPFEEVSFPVEEGVDLHGVVFRADSAEGLVYYLHGSGVSVEYLGSLPQLVTSQGYDLVAIDYRGFGKSGGEIATQEEFREDVQEVLNQVAPQYDNIILYGYSFGTGLAAELSSQANESVSAVVLEAPFYSYADLLAHQFPWFLPSQLITSYDFDTHEILGEVQAPIYVFHGQRDENIYYGSSERLKSEHPSIEFISLPEADHFNIKENDAFRRSLVSILQPENIGLHIQP
ncbi:MAG: alpha/beta fold hydrolase [Bacteroidota bacterium]